MLRNNIKEIPFSEPEKAFFAAIDRILQGKPKHKDLQPAALAAAKRKLRLTVATMSLEAGYARSYVYKNPDTMQRVMKRFEDATRPRKPGPTAADVIARLRAENKQLKTERDVAIDVTRRWMQEAQRLQETVKLRERQLAAATGTARTTQDNVITLPSSKR